MRCDIGVPGWLPVSICPMMNCTVLQLLITEKVTGSFGGLGLDDGTHLSFKDMPQRHDSCRRI